MNVKQKKIEIELNSSEKDLIYAMHNFTNQYCEKTNCYECLSCINCPLNLFCYKKDTDKEEVIERILSEIEKHANGEI